MKVKNNFTKKAILNIVSFTDEVNEQGNPAPRKSYKKDYLRGVLEIKNAVVDVMEVGVKEGKEVVYKPVKDVMKEDQGNIVEERYLDTEIELSDKALKALKYYYDERDELEEMPVQALEELEGLFSKE